MHTSQFLVLKNLQLNVIQLQLVLIDNLPLTLVLLLIQIILTKNLILTQPPNNLNVKSLVL